ncbi:hypothetical protein Tco_1236633 [Tanacetum coccineum]
MERNWMYDMNITDPKYVNGVQSFLIAAESNRVAMEDIEIVHVRNIGDAAGPSNVVARCAIDEIIELGGENKTPKYMKVNAMIAEMEAMDDQEEYYDSLMCLRDSRRMGNDKLMGLNEMIYEAEEEINTKEAHLEIMEATIKFE